MILAISLLAAACTNGSVEDPGTTLSPSPSTSASLSPATTEPSRPTTTTGDRGLEVVECENAPEEIEIVCEAYDLIKEQYVDDIDDETLAAAAAEGLSQLDGPASSELLVCATPDDAFASVCDVAAATADDSKEAAEAMVAGLAAFALDPNSGYFDPEALDLLQEEQTGEIEGIGALVSPEDQTIPGDNKQCGVISTTCEMLIVSTISGAPAEAAGLLRDDKIVAVDGEDIVGWTVDEVTATVRGPSGSNVTLTVERGGERLDISITRAAVVIPLIEQEVVGSVGYVNLRSFTGSADSQFETAIVDLLAAGVDELVIDLRDNPGGFLTSAIDVTSIFLASGDVIVTQGPQETIEYPVNGDAIVPPNMSVTIVINKGSASASEVVAAALQERGRATVVGESSFGKNTVQQRFSLSNGGALKLTIARWVTPGGLDFGGVGVTPDIALDVSGLEAAELVAAVTGP